MTPGVIGGCSASDMTHNRETLPELIPVWLLHSDTVRPLTSGKAFHRRIDEVSEVGPVTDRSVEKAKPAPVSHLSSAAVHICSADLLFFSPPFLTTSGIS